MTIITGKNVCVVSYSSGMLNKKRGALIDSFDTIVRVNNGIVILNKADFGSRTDVFSTVGYPGKLKLIKNSYNEFYKTKYVIPLDMLKSLKIPIISQGWGDLPPKLLASYLEFDKKLYTTGITTIMHVVSLKPKKLFITGFSFSNHLYPGYDTFFKKYKTISIPRLGKEFSEQEGCLHNKQLELYITKRMSIDYTDIEFQFDEELQQLLNDTPSFDDQLEIKYAQVKKIIDTGKVL